MILVAGQWPRTPASLAITGLQVQGGFDAAGDEPAARTVARVLFAIQDNPLASHVPARGAAAIDPRGECFTPDDVGEHRSVHDGFDQLRGAGVQSGGPAAFGARDSPGNG